MMPDQMFVYATAAVIVLMILANVFRREFDPFAPLWLFLAGYAQVYVVQAISYRDYALRARGMDVVFEANSRALWALLWFLAVYHCGLGKVIARTLPRAPRAWSPGLVSAVAPVMILWGLVCSGILLSGPRDEPISDGEDLLRQFPMFMLVGGNLLLVTGREIGKRRPLFTLAGLAVCVMYVAIWMFNGKRSHAIFGVLTTVCAYYITRFRRPSIPVMAATGLACMVVLTLALGWRNNVLYERTVSGFMQFVGDFNSDSILVNLNMKERPGTKVTSKSATSKETEEYGGYLLMLDTVPEKAGYDYGRTYCRVWSTYIPRMFWHSKPFYGRDEWLAAWKAGSEFKRDDSFAGPAVGILGASQLNGGRLGTVIVLGILALMLRTGYDYFRTYADCPWAQVFWAMTYFNAWLTTVNDNPMVWFYYIYGHTTLLPLACFWVANRYLERGQVTAAACRFSPQGA
jgi:hypothetical protein